MNLTLRTYQPSDAAMIASWLKSEYLMRQWCADRYDRYPVMPEDINSYHEKYIDGQQSRALTMTDGDEIVDTSLTYPRRRFDRAATGIRHC